MPQMHMISGVSQYQAKVKVIFQYRDKYMTKRADSKTSAANALFIEPS